MSTAKKRSFSDRYCPKPSKNVQLTVPQPKPKDSQPKPEPNSDFDINEASQTDISVDSKIQASLASEPRKRIVLEQNSKMTLIVPQEPNKRRARPPIKNAVMYIPSAGNLIRHPFASPASEDGQEVERKYKIGPSGIRPYEVSPPRDKNTPFVLKVKDSEHVGAEKEEKHEPMEESEAEGVKEEILDENDYEIIIEGGAPPNTSKVKPKSGRQSGKQTSACQPWSPAPRTTDIGTTVGGEADVDQSMNLDMRNWTIYRKYPSISMDMRQWKIREMPTHRKEKSGSVKARQTRKTPHLVSPDPKHVNMIDDKKIKLRFDHLRRKFISAPKPEGTDERMDVPEIDMRDDEMKTEEHETQENQDAGSVEIVTDERSGQIVTDERSGQQYYDLSNSTCTGVEQQVAMYTQNAAAMNEGSLVSTLNEAVSTSFNPSNFYEQPGYASTTSNHMVTGQPLILQNVAEPQQLTHAGYLEDNQALDSTLVKLHDFREGLLPKGDAEAEISYIQVFSDSFESNLTAPHVSGLIQNDANPVITHIQALGESVNPGCIVTGNEAVSGPDSNSLNSTIALPEIVSTSQNLLGLKNEEETSLASSQMIAGTKPKPEENILAPPPEFQTTHSTNKIQGDPDSASITNDQKVMSNGHGAVAIETSNQQQHLDSNTDSCSENALMIEEKNAEETDGEDSQVPSKDLDVPAETIINKCVGDVGELRTMEFDLSNLS